MDYIIRTPVHKRTPLHFLVDGLQVWVSYLDANENGPYGVRLMWMEDQYSCSPLQHITDDGGQTYKKYESFMLLGSGALDMRIGEVETDPEKLNRLQKILVEYQKKLGEEV